ncbi:hypothetical protein ACSAZK_09050 [Methanosarcina sp. Mfa9]
MEEEQIEKMETKIIKKVGKNIKKKVEKKRRIPGIKGSLRP